MRLLPLLCPLLLVLAFIDVLGGLGEEPAAEAVQESLPTVHVVIGKNAATADQADARLSTQQDGSVQLILLVDGVEVRHDVVETSNGFSITAPKDI